MFPGKNVKSTPSKVGGDRFIPTRNGKQMDTASFLLTKENEPMDTNESIASAVSLFYAIVFIHIRAGFN